MSLRVVTTGAMVAAGLLVPIERSTAPAPRSPLAAARLVEDISGPEGLTWGKLRAWRRLDDGWLLLWQPSHGAWLLRALVRDDFSPVLWRLQAAPWLPGVRLSEPLARLVVGAQQGAEPQRLERPSRRDWSFAGQRLAGAIVVGSDVPEPEIRAPGPWPALLAGALLAGALCLVLLPGNITHRWTVTLTVSLASLLAAAPSVVALAYWAFQVGVRPWVAQFAVFAAVALASAAVVTFAARFGALRGRPRALELAAAAGVGLAAGRLEPEAIFASVAGLTARPLVWAAASLTLGYLAAVAAIGLRELLHPVRGLRLPVLAALLATAATTAGSWLGPIAAMVVAAAVPRTRAVWTSTTLVGSWILGSTLTTCGWVEPLRDVALLLLAGTGGLAALALAEG